MIYGTSAAAISIFCFFVAVVLGLSFYLGRKAKSAAGYYAAHGQINWFVNGVAFAGDYLSAASFLGICGMIAFYGYDGFLYSIGYLAGWIVALFVIAEPIKRLGRFTFADALDAQFDSRSIKLVAAISTLVVSVFYLIPQMVGAGALITPLLGLPHWAGVLIVGITVTLIVVTAGMVSTTWVQFIKGSLLVLFCTILVFMILGRGLKVTAPRPEPSADASAAALSSTATHLEAGFITTNEYALVHNSNAVKVDLGETWTKIPKLKFVRYRFPDNSERTFRVNPVPADALIAAQPILTEAQVLTTGADGHTFVNGLPQTAANDLRPIGTVSALPDGKTETGPLGPLSFLHTLNDSTIVTWSKVSVADAAGKNDVYFQVPLPGSKLLTPGASPTFSGVRSKDLFKKLDFISLMLALFCGTASLPHILIRYYTVKDQASARKSTIVGIAAIGFFYVLTLYLGLGAMTSAHLDPTNNNMAAPLLARSFSETLFAVISAIAFTTVLGTVSGLIMAGSGAVAHDLMETFLRIKMTDHQKVLSGKTAAAFLGVGAMVLGILFKEFNVSFLVGWAFNIAASANLPALVMLLFWKRTTAKGIAAAIGVGLITSLGWILLSPQCYKDVYHWDPTHSIIPFSQPALVTIPLGFLTLVVVSLLTSRRRVVRAG
jgi:cation/acetate symporter